MEHIDNPDGTRTLLAGKSLLSLIAAIQAKPGITGPELHAALADTVKAGTVDHHLDRLHLRGAIAKRPTGQPWAGRGRAPLGIHWTGAYQVVDAEAQAEARRAEAEANKAAGGTRVRTPATSEECLAKAEALRTRARELWAASKGLPFARSEFDSVVEKVSGLYERAARLTFRAEAITRAAGMTFGPEPVPAPEAPKAEAEATPAPEAPKAKGKKGKKAQAEASA